MLLDIREEKSASRRLNLVIEERLEQLMT